jgi:CheY-like chemotaxis protein
MAMGRVLALVDDLIFQTKILETAKHAGARVQVVATPEAFLAALAAQDGQSPALLIVDLNAPGDAVGAIASLRSFGNQVPVVAFLSHVQTELAERARAAGATHVLPRSKFTQELASILLRGEPSG